MGVCSITEFERLFQTLHLHSGAKWKHLERQDSIFSSETLSKDSRSRKYNVVDNCYRNSIILHHVLTYNVHTTHISLFLPQDFAQNKSLDSGLALPFHLNRSSILMLQKVCAHSSPIT